MNEDEVLRIQRMVAEGKVTPEESVELLASVPRDDAPPTDDAHEPGGMRMQAEAVIELDKAGVRRAGRWSLVLFLAGLAVAAIWVASFAVGMEGPRGDGAAIQTITVAEPLPFAIAAGVLWLAALACGIVGWRTVSGRIGAFGSLLMVLAAGGALVAGANGPTPVASSHGSAGGNPLTDDADRKARRLLASVGTQVYTELLPELAGDVSPEALMARAAKMAGGALEPNADLLVAAAEERLAELDDAPEQGSIRWEPVDPPLAAEATRGVESEMADQLETFRRKEPSLSREDLLLAMGWWDPAVAAEGARNLVLARMLAAERYAGRAMLTNIARPRVFAIDRTAGAPVIGIQTGSEKWVVHLKRIRGGAYMPTKVEWLKRKYGAGQPQ